jgi:hypothetical protein
MPEAGNIRWAHASFVAAGLDHGMERLDAAAGCEFVDDRIRIPE